MKIDFEVQTKYGLYRDALYFPDNEPLPDDAAIEAMKQERADNWVAFIEFPPPPPPPEETLPEEGNG